MKILWKGSGENEKAYWHDNVIIEIDKRYFRPTEVNSLRGDSSLAKKELNWEVKFNISDLIKDMVKEDLNH